MYTQVGTKLISIKEGTYGTFYFVHKNYDSAKDRLVMTWNNGMEKSTSLYSYISEMALFTQDMVNDKVSDLRVLFTQDVVYDKVSDLLKVLFLLRVWLMIK